MFTTEPQQIIVGFAAFKQSGKNTAASLLAKQFPEFECHTLGFADALKAEVAGILGVTPEHLEANKATFRSNLQDHGQEAKKSRGELCWVTELSKTMQKKIDKKKNQLFLITDVRFPFEAKWIKELGGFLVRVERFDSTEDQHESETSVLKIRDIDYYLPNKGTLRDLERECKWLGQILRVRYHLI